MFRARLCFNRNAKGTEIEAELCIFGTFLVLGVLHWAFQAFR